ncbi:MAG: GDSL-type esterase/lipase family protein, partial [Ruthenibacterium sp.]
MKSQKSSKSKQKTPVSALEQKARRMLLCCALAFALVVLSSTVFIFGQRKSKPSISPKPGQTQGTNSASAAAQKSEYADVILPQTADAGDAYLADTVFVGDSNTVRMWMYEQVPLANYMGLEGMGAEGIPSVQCVYFEGDSTVYTVPQAVKMTQPRRIILGFGTNNADGNMTTESFVKTYRDGVALLQKASPHSDIIISAIPPVAYSRAYPNINMTSIDSFNTALMQLARELKLSFLNTTEVLKGENGYAKTDFMYEDGLHYNLDGVKLVLAYARTHAHETADLRPSHTSPTRRKPPVAVSSSAPEEVQPTPTPEPQPTPPVSSSATPPVTEPPATVPTTPPVTEPPAVVPTPPPVTEPPATVPTPPPVTEPP